MATDQDLVARLAAGDQAALEELLRRWDRPLHAFVARQTGGMEVEDLRQETWLRVLRAADRFQPDKTFSTWLFAIALNLCRDWYRRRPASPMESEAVERALQAGDGDPPAPEDALEARRLLAQLPESLRSAVTLRYYHDMSEEQMAEVLGIPRGTVKSRLHHAVRRLMQLCRVRGPAGGARPAGGGSP
jgi:RNA polymerase sigma-70 factor, ECF subfamily